MTYLSEYTRINLDTLHTRNKEKLALDHAIKCRENITNPTVKGISARFQGMDIK